jgi:hypothetical protein
VGYDSGTSFVGPGIDLHFITQPVNDYGCQNDSFGCYPGQPEGTFSGDGCDAKFVCGHAPNDTF